MTDVAQQMPLPLPRKPQEVDIEAVRRQPSLTKAIILCADLAGFVNDKDLCRVLEIDPPVWARIKSGQACFPQEKINPLMDEAGNEVPLIWLADRRGYRLVRLESSLERELRETQEALAKSEELRGYAEALLTGRAGK